jgi:hypothetical protein
MKSPHIKMHEQHLQKGMFVEMENFGIESKSEKVFETCDITFQPKLVPMFFHMNSIKEFKIGGCYHCCHRHWCKGSRG